MVSHCFWGRCTRNPGSGSYEPEVVTVPQNFCRPETFHVLCMSHDVLRHLSNVTRLSLDELVFWNNPKASKGTLKRHSKSH